MIVHAGVLEMSAARSETAAATRARPQRNADEGITNNSSAVARKSQAHHFNRYAIVTRFPRCCNRSARAAARRLDSLGPQCERRLAVSSAHSRGRTRRADSANLLKEGRSRDRWGWCCHFSPRPPPPSRPLDGHAAHGCAAVRHRSRAEPISERPRLRGGVGWFLSGGNLDRAR
jgi:hypothetical protein